ncbi:hypothetical protein AAVH_18262 [Aphelenchoides avenae]|nr:hypothetical protein AAVH_18262 [Aphelenchus avenae]
MIEAVAMYDFGAIMTTIAIVYCELKVMQKLKTAAEMMRPATRRMHDETNKALIALAVAPLILSCLPIGFFLFTIVARINPGPIMAVITSQLSWIAIANPITTTFFVRPYRHAVLGWFKVPHSRVTDVTYARGRTDGEPKSTGGGLSVARGTLSDSKHSSVNS